VVVDLKSGKVSCDDDASRARIEKAVLRVAEAMKPCSLDYDN